MYKCVATAMRDAEKPSRCLDDRIHGRVDWHARLVVRFTPGC